MPLCFLFTRKKPLISTIWANSPQQTNMPVLESFMARSKRCLHGEQQLLTTPVRGHLVIVSGPWLLINNWIISALREAPRFHYVRVERDGLKNHHCFSGWCLFMFVPSVPFRLFMGCNQNPLWLTVIVKILFLAFVWATCRVQLLLSRKRHKSSDSWNFYF